MPKKQGTAAKKARRNQAVTGAPYMHELRAVGRPSDTAQTPVLAKEFLAEIVAELGKLGYGAGAVYHEAQWYQSHLGPLGLQVERKVDDDGNFDRDPDDPADVDISQAVWFHTRAPWMACSEDDFEFNATSGNQPVASLVRELDAELGQARLRRVRDADEHATTPCPICGDRYASEHLLANCDDAPPVCPACVFDQDQPYRTDLPFLAVEIDELLDKDLSAPAGWSAVAALLTLVCGSHLGRKIDRELAEFGAWNQTHPRWHDPAARSWIWLPPPSARHEAFRELGAGATVTQLTDALLRHDPTVQTRARQLLRDDHIAWRSGILTAAVGYAVAFSTQAHERDRHRVPVHVVDSTADGLSQIMEPFKVAGKAENVEYGLQTLLEALLFPLLLGHGLYEEQPHDPRRWYGATEDDTRPPRTRRDAHISHDIDRDAQVSVVLGHATLGLVSQKTLWEGTAAPAQAGERLGSTAPVNDEIDGLRRHARVEAARAAYDHGGPISMTADNAWASTGWWIPADEAPHAVRQARDFLASNPRIDVLWAGPSGSLPEPAWVCVDVLHFDAHSTGPADVPWISVSDGRSIFGITLADIAAVRRVTSTTPLT